MSKVDIKDAYYSVHILPEHQRYLKFYFRGKLCQFTCLPNGLCSGPRKIYKIAKTLLFVSKVTTSYCSRFYWWFNYIGESFVTGERNIKLIVTLLDSLGIVVHPNKSITVPARSIKYLDFGTDFQSTTISLTKKKKACIKHLCHEVLQKEFLIIRKVWDYQVNLQAVFLQCVWPIGLQVFGTG